VHDVDGIHLYASSLHVRVWPRGEGSGFEESRFEHGQVLARRGDEGWISEATDDLDARLSPLELGLEHRDWLRSLRKTEIPVAVSPVRGNLSIISQRRVVIDAHGAHAGESHVAILERDGVSYAFSPERLTFPAENEGPRVAAPPSAPLLFTNGTAAILFHELLGHPAEEGILADLPSWLRVTDEPASSRAFSPTDHDDCGRPTRPARLGSEGLTALRRWSFRDLPLPRMSHLEVECSLPIALPDEYIEISHLGEGAFDPLRDEVTLVIAAGMIVRQGERQPVHPFALRSSRVALLGSIEGAPPNTIARSLVICSSHGQRLPVSGASPDILVKR
jgi:hypothetical protein